MTFLALASTYSMNSIRKVIGNHLSVACHSRGTSRSAGVGTKLLSGCHTKFSGMCRSSFADCRRLSLVVGESILWQLASD